MKVACDPDQRARLYQLLGTFCHQCRNDLNTLRLSLYLLGRAGPVGDASLWADQEGRYRVVEQVVDRLQQICRPMHLTPVRLPIALLWDEVFPVWADQLGRRGIRFEPVAPPGPAVGDFDPVRLRPALDALAHWRAEAAPGGAVVTFTWRIHDDWFEVDWAESAGGPCVDGQGPSDGFAVPLLARVLTAHGGTAQFTSRPNFGASLRWPSAIRVHE